MQLRQDLDVGLLEGTGDGPEEPSELGVVEPGQADPPASAPLEVDERRAQLGGGVGFGVAVAGDQEHGGIDEGPAEVAEEEQRGGLGPVQVVEDEGERPVRRHPPEEVGHRLEQLMALGRGVGGDRRRRPQAIAEPRRDPEELAAAPLAVLLEQRQRRVLDQRRHDREERLERNRGPLGTAAERHHVAGLPVLGPGERGEQRRLADPRLAAQQRGTHRT